MERIQKKLGFGMMRLPMIGEEVDIEQTCRMVDAFLQRGFNYFDTAHGYIGGKSEQAVKTCLADRYPRASYVLTDKLTENYFERQSDIPLFLEKQLQICGVDYFDFYLMHAQNANNFKKFKACRAYETALELKAQGKIRHLGISFHDSAAVLDQILTEYPQVEIVQIQFNYLDYEDEGVQSRQCYEVCRKHKKPVLIMEPVKGGRLVNLPKEAIDRFAALGKYSAASYAIRFAAGFDGVVSVLSGMSNLAQMEDNLSYMEEFQPLSATELEAVAYVRNLLRPQDVISCTACRYCTDGCPAGIAIPDLFALQNEKKLYQKRTQADYLALLAKTNSANASACLDCGACEAVCPQHLPIRTLLQTVAKEFEA